MSIDRSIDLCYKMLMVLWIVGAVALGYSVLQEDAQPGCDLAMSHFHKG
ncbi:MAG: hypothetical protein HWE25_02955 [Alphaproteobacteria bacterium]|nr:hypothetical protein [Alphaproteobacteria bacterium]